MSLVSWLKKNLLHKLVPIFFCIVGDRSGGLSGIGRRHRTAGNFSFGRKIGKSRLSLSVVRQTKLSIGLGSLCVCVCSEQKDWDE